ncbi:MAG: cytidine deaminase, partial [Bacteroidetes bacterium]
MKEKKHSIDYIEYERMEELSKKDQDILTIAISAAEGAYAPYSDFHVGAAIRLSNNTIIKGSNQENAAYPSGLCA